MAGHISFGATWLEAPLTAGWGPNLKRLGTFPAEVKYYILDTKTEEHCPICDLSATPSSKVEAWMHPLRVKVQSDRRCSPPEPTAI